MKDTTTASQIVPPHSVEAEQSAIAAMLLDAGALESVAGLVTAQDFYRSEHQLIFQTIVDMDGRRVAVDMTTLHSELVSLGRLEAAGGLPYIAGLFDVLPTSVNALYYAQIVLDKSLLRSMQVFYDRNARALVSGGGNAFALLQSAQKDICALGHHRGVNDLIPLSRFVGSVYSEAEVNAVAGGLPIGLQTGFTALDDRTGGLSDTDLIIIAARPSMGKTALVLAMADHVTRLQKKPVALFSLEMSAGQVATRLMSSLTGIDSNALRCGKMNISEWAKLADASAELYEAPLRIDDSLDSGIQGMRSRCRRMMADGGLSLVIVDYLQLMAPEGRQENRNQEVAKISRELKAMGRELRVPVIALSRLSRTVESRADKRPLLSDLRDSGAIEQDADMIVFLYNDAYYNSASVYPYDQDGRPAAQEVEIIVAKNRNGWTGTVRLGFVKPFARFQNLLD